MPEFEPILGHYAGIDIAGETHRIFLEESGSGISLLCLHTAGNDSQCDVEVLLHFENQRPNQHHRDRVWCRRLET